MHQYVQTILEEAFWQPKNLAWRCKNVSTNAPTGTEQEEDDPGNKYKIKQHYQHSPNVSKIKQPNKIYVPIYNPLPLLNYPTLYP